MKTNGDSQDEYTIQCTLIEAIFAGEPLIQQQKYSSSLSPVPPVYPFGRQNSIINIVSHMPCRSHVKQTKKWRKEISRTHTQATSSPPTSLSPEIQIHFALVTSFGTCMCIEFSDSKVLVCHKSTSPHNHQHTHALSQSADKFILIRSGFYFSFFHECRLPSPSPKIRASLPPSPI